MNRFVHAALGHFLFDELEEGQDLPGADVQEPEEPEPEGEPEPEAEPEVDDAEEVVISIGEERLNEDEDDKSASPAMREMRKRIREQNREIRELKAVATKASQSSAPPKIEVGAKPSLADCDYDEEVFDQKLTAWYERKRQADQQAESQRREQEEAEADWQKDLSSYQEKKAALKLPDFDEAEAALAGIFDENRLAMVVKAADNPALVMYALGKSQQQAKALSAIKDPVKFIAAVARLEGKVSMAKKEKAKPAPERTVSGTAPKSGAVDSNLERLRAEAEKTGDMSKVMEYRRQQRAKA